MWRPTSIAAIPIGYEIGVTTLQLARAYSALANGGLLVKPRLRLDASPPAASRIIHPETAIALRAMFSGR